MGIGEEQAEHILTSFYMSLDSQHQGESSPPKRARRLSHNDEGWSETNDEGDEGASGPVNFPSESAPEEGVLTA